jgi:hypothetical protein
MGILLSFPAGKLLSGVEQSTTVEGTFNSDHKDRIPFYHFNESSDEPVSRLPPPGSIRDWRTEDDQFALGNPIV